MVCALSKDMKFASIGGLREAVWIVAEGSKGMAFFKHISWMSYRLGLCRANIRLLMGMLNDFQVSHCNLRIQVIYSALNGPITFVCIVTTLDLWLGCSGLGLGVKVCLELNRHLTLCVWCLAPASSAYWSSLDMKQLIRCALLVKNLGWLWRNAVLIPNLLFGAKGTLV